MVRGDKLIAIYEGRAECKISKYAVLGTSLFF